jgi:succinyl-CoA synthetase beta subunit
VPRVKISEFRSKNILYSAFAQPYSGLSVDSAGDWQKQLAKLSKTKRYVVKVDQGVKGRFKKGLVLLDRKPTQLKADVLALSKKGYRYLLIEEFKHHSAESESYLSIERTRAGNMVMFSTAGGIDVESSATAMKSSLMKPSSAASVEEALNLNPGTMEKLMAAFENNFMAFMEVNPLVVSDGMPNFLDAAIEVDSEAGPFVK